jgi:hypothetical protein
MPSKWVAFWFAGPFTIESPTRPKFFVAHSLSYGESVTRPCGGRPGGPAGALPGRGYAYVVQRVRHVPDR